MYLYCVYVYRQFQIRSAVSLIMQNIWNNHQFAANPLTNTTQTKFLKSYVNGLVIPPLLNGFKVLPLESDQVRLCIIFF